MTYPIGHYSPKVPVFAQPPFHDRHAPAAPSLSELQYSITGYSCRSIVNIGQGVLELSLSTPAKRETSTSHSELYSTYCDTSCLRPSLTTANCLTQHPASPLCLSSSRLVEDGHLGTLARSEEKRRYRLVAKLLK